MRKIILWGATGQAKVLWELLQYSGFQVVAIFDNNPEIKFLSVSKKIPVLHGKEAFYKWKQNCGELDEIYGLAAIGGERGQDRVSMHHFFEQNGIKIFTAIHPRSFVANDATVGAGCQILANAAIASEAVLAGSCIVNTSASVDHECVLGEGVHVGPGARLAGLVRVSDYAFIGTGAIILPRLSIGLATIVGAGAVVTKNIGDNLVVVGNPARILERNERSE